MLNNAKVIAGLKALANGFSLIAEGLESAETVVKTTTAPAKVAPTQAPAPKVAVQPAPTQAPAPAEEMIEGKLIITAEELAGMSYNNLKKFAKDLGASAVGSRDEITERLLALSGTIDVEVAPEDVVEPEEVEEAETAEEAEEVEDAETVEEEADEEESDTEKQVIEATKDMTDEEIASFLADVGISPKGKRQALIAKVVKAVEEGVIDLGGEEEAEVPEETEGEAEATDEGTDVEMTEARTKAYEAYDKEIRAGFEAKEITRASILEWLDEFTGMDYSEFDNEQLLDAYVEQSASFIDDEGKDVEEPGAYTVNGVPYCCGKPLKEVDNTFICEVCGAEYEGE